MENGAVPAAIHSRSLRRPATSVFVTTVHSLRCVVIVDKDSNEVCIWLEQRHSCKNCKRRGSDMHTSRFTRVDESLQPALHFLALLHL